SRGSWYRCRSCSVSRTSCSTCPWRSARDTWRRRWPSSEPSWWRIMSSRVSSYIQLTKPRIVLLVLVTALAALVMEGSLLARPGQLLLVLFAITLVAGSANAFNQYFERDLDAQMARTRARRP